MKQYSLHQSLHIRKRRKQFNKEVPFMEWAGIGIAYFALLIAVIVPIIAFITAVIITKLALKAKLNKQELLHKERLMLIEKGLIDKAQFVFTEGAPSKRRLYLYLVWGFILAAFGIALLVSLFVTKLVTGRISDAQDFITFGLIFSFVGVGLFLFYMIQSKKEKDENTIRNQPHS